MTVAESEALYAIRSNLPEISKQLRIANMLKLAKSLEATGHANASASILVEVCKELEVKVEV